MSDRQLKHRPLRTEVIEGDPIQVRGRELVPLVRKISYVQRRASVGDGRVAGQGWGFVSLSPTAVLVHGGESGRHLVIRDQTAAWIRWLLLAALLVPCVAAILIYASHRSDGCAS